MVSPRLVLAGVLEGKQNRRQAGKHNWHLPALEI